MDRLKKLWSKVARRKRDKRMYIGIGVVVLASVIIGALVLVDGGAHNPFEKGKDEEVVIAKVEKDPNNAELPLRYIHEEFNYSINFPEGFTVGELREAGGEIHIARFNNQQTNTEFQIATRSFDERGPLTPERIREDLPDVVIKEPQHVVVGDNITALLFESADDAGMPTREVWFIDGGLLVQVTTALGNDAVIGPVLETWRKTE